MSLVIGRSMVRPLGCDKNVADLTPDSGRRVSKPCDVLGDCYGARDTERCSLGISFREPSLIRQRMSSFSQLLKQGIRPSSRKSSWEDVDPPG